MIAMRRMALIKLRLLKGASDIMSTEVGAMNAER
jgi:hypothetical protein